MHPKPNQDYHRRATSIANFTGLPSIEASMPPPAQLSGATLARNITSMPLLLFLHTFFYILFNWIFLIVVFGCEKLNRRMIEDGEDK